MAAQREYVGRFVGTNADAKANGDAKASSAASSHLSTAVKWSTLSERIQGLLVEATTIGVGQEEYCLRMSSMEGPAMRAIRTKMMSTDWAGAWAAKKTMWAYGEEMSTDPLEAQLLKALIAMKQPRRVLEVGMFTGYGAAAMLEGCPSANVVSLEIDPFLKPWCAEALAATPDVAARHTVVTGAALETLVTLDGVFEVVFIDANKSEYKRYVEILLERKLLAPGATILADNTLYCGCPFTDPRFDAQPARRGFGESIKEFNEFVKQHPAFQQVILPMRDGVSVILYRPPPAAPESSA